jgi:transposase
MTKPLSNDLRERVVAAVAEGHSRRETAERFGVAPSTVVKWMRRWRETGSVAPTRQGGDRRSQRIEAHADEILGLIAATPDITLEEIVGYLASTRGKLFAQSTVWRLLDRHGVTFKKNSARQRARAARRGGRAAGVARRAA